jgi:pimeloyl-ACP methyl ester carboxylesterase
VKIDHAGITLHVAEDGNPTAPPLLLLHGITSFGGTWNWFVPELAERFRVLRLDFRGHGASDRAPGRYSSAGYVGDVFAVCEQAIGEPCTVMGHSLGGITALAAIQQRPELFLAAVLEDPPMVPAARAAESVGEGHALLDGFRVMRQSLPGLQAAGLAPEAVAGVLGAMPTSTGSTMGETLEADGLVTMAGSLLAVDPAVLDPVLEGTLDRSQFDATRGIERPALILTADPAEPDAICDPEAAHELAARSPAVEVVTVGGAGHLIHDQIGARATFRDAVIEFLDRVTSA